MKKVIFTIAMMMQTVVSVEATVIWSGERTYANGRALPTPEDRVTIDASAFAGAVVGDRLLFEFTNYADDPLTTQHLIRLSVPKTYEDLKHNINVSEGDKKASVNIDEVLLAKLKASGLVLGGTGYTVTSISLEPDNGTLWEGYKVINNSGWTSGIIDASQLANVSAGDVLTITAEKTGDGAQCVLIERGSNPWKALPSGDTPSTLTNFSDDGISQLTFTFNDEAAQIVKTNGIIITGLEYTLLAVSVSSLTAIEVAKQAPFSTTVYSIGGIKEAENTRNPPTHPGIYIINGKKILKH